jgi:hypothetical protein
MGRRTFALTLESALKDLATSLSVFFSGFVAYFPSTSLKDRSNKLRSIWCRSSGVIKRIGFGDILKALENRLF